MKILNKFKTILAGIIICLLFTANTFANVNTENNCNKPIIETINNEPSCVFIINKDLNNYDILIRDGKFWKALKEFWDGFLDGYTGGPMPSFGGGNSGGNNEELSQHIKKFAKNHVRNKDNAYRIFYKMQKLIDSDKKTVSKKEILDIINPKSNDRPQPRWLKELLDDIFKDSGISPKPTVKPNSNIHKKPIKLNKRNLKSKKVLVRGKPNHKDKILKRKINWGRLGWIVGKIIEILF